jgi:hypothetical protein
LEVLHVLHGDGGGREANAWRVDALVLAEHAAFDDPRPNLRAVGVEHGELDDAVRQKEVIALLHAARQSFEGRRDEAGPAEPVAGHDPQFVAGLELDVASAFEEAGADLRPAEILQDRHFATGALGRGPHAREGRALRRVRAV